MIWRLHTTTHAPQSTKTKNKHPHVHARESKKVWILLTRPVSLLNRGFLFSRYGPRGRPSARAPFCVRCSRPHATPAELGKSTIDRVRIACDVASCAVPIIHTNLIVLTTEQSNSCFDWGYILWISSFELCPTKNLQILTITCTEWTLSVPYQRTMRLTVNPPF